jgi:hypothetical protein
MMTQARLINKLHAQFENLPSSFDVIESSETGGGDSVMGVSFKNCGASMTLGYNKKKLGQKESTELNTLNKQTYL